jgi:hypothetical protein
MRKGGELMILQNFWAKSCHAPRALAQEVTKHVREAFKTFLKHLLLKAVMPYQLIIFQGPNVDDTPESERTPQEIQARVELEAKGVKFVGSGAPDGEFDIFAKLEEPRMVVPDRHAAGNVGDGGARHCRQEQPVYSIPAIRVEPRGGN